MPRLARENTLRSFALALEAGADGIELDVHATADGVVVVHHDPTLADGHPIAAGTLRELRDHEPPIGETIPTLDAVCRLVRGRAELFVEVKGVGIEHEVLAVLEGCEGAHAVHSFDHALIARAHALDPTLRVGLLFDESPESLPASMAATGARDIWPREQLVTRELVAAVHDRGGRVIPWTVNDSAEATRLLALGVDALCGDDVRIFPSR
jgi:glycerophosphoryl diester phosphodiesterase